ncbi:MAG: aminotransferase class I/II-fold pyridoxal phosphate-dependent enzyme [Candidatus Riflebacteria bacterium]|nr:aminotransferase class I/II-fold pyridoxal phosphate-dependent enzyme [Candidatus Riflebacteria bacterium]
MAIRPFELERYFAEHEFSAKYLLGSSDPEAMSVEDLLVFEPGAESGLKKIWLGYTESLGDPALRRDIAALYESVTPEQVLVFTGAEEPIFAFMHAVLEPGDHIVVHFPGYQSHYSVAESRGIEVSHWHGDPLQNWAPDLSELPKLIKPNTKALLICTPHNPTGYLFDRAAWQHVIEIARQHNLYLFCDEVYRGLEHDPTDRLPHLADHYEKGVSLNCLSKNCGLAGLRIGWIATKDRHIYNRLAMFKDYLTICNCAPGEYLAGIAVRNIGKIFEQQRLRLVRNLDLLEDFFKRHEALFSWQRPRAGTVTFPGYLAGSALEFCNKLVTEAGIMLIPGTFFDMSGEYLRFGYGRATFAEVLNRLDEYLSV